MKAIAILIVCLLVIGCVSTTSKELQNTQANIGIDEIICNYEKPIGSHVPRRVCRTKNEIAREAEETRKVLEELPLKTRTNY